MMRMDDGKTQSADRSKGRDRFCAHPWMIEWSRRRIIRMARFLQVILMRRNYHIDLGIAFKEGCNNKHNEYVDYGSLHFSLRVCDICFQFWCY
jgi:hypothetical protein